MKTLCKRPLPFYTLKSYDHRQAGRFCCRFFNIARYTGIAACGGHAPCPGYIVWRLSLGSHQKRRGGQPGGAWNGFVDFGEALTRAGSAQQNQQAQQYAWMGAQQTFFLQRAPLFTENGRQAFPFFGTASVLPKCQICSLCKTEKARKLGQNCTLGSTKSAHFTRGGKCAIMKKEEGTEE